MVSWSSWKIINKKIKWWSYITNTTDFIRDQNKTLRMEN